MNKIKASFLLGICDFSKWDPPVTGKKKIGVVGDDHLFRELNSLLKSTKGLSDDYEILRVVDSSILESLHAIYVGKEEEQYWAEILISNRDLPLVKMGDSDFFFEECGTIIFRANKNRLTFSINIDGIPKGVKLSSKLMSLSSNF